MVPDYQAFSQLAKHATLIPVAKTLSADLLTPVAAFLTLAEKEPHSFLRESVEGGEKVGRYTFLGLRPYMVLTARGEQITVTRGKKSMKQRGPLLAALRDLFAEHRIAQVPG